MMIWIDSEPDAKLGQYVISICKLIFHSHFVHVTESRDLNLQKMFISNECALGVLFNPGASRKRLIFENM